VRLVRAAQLRGHHPLKLNPQLLARGFEEIIIDVGDHPQPETRSQTRQGLHRVRERLPPLDRVRKAVLLALLGREGIRLADAAHDRAQHLAVRDVFSGLRVRFEARVMSEQLVVRRPHAAHREDRSERLQDPSLPVDQGAVAVERHRVEAGEVDHDRLLARRARRRCAPADRIITVPITRNGTPAAPVTN
jgi:hypothetical protein